MEEEKGEKERLLIDFSITLFKNVLLTKFGEIYFFVPILFHQSMDISSFQYQSNLIGVA